MVITPEITKTPKKRKNKKPPSLSKDTHWGAIAFILLLTLIGYLLIVSEAAAHGLEVAKSTEALKAPVPKVEPEKPQLPTPTPKIAVEAKTSPTSGSENEARIREIAKEMGLTQEQENRAVKIGYCESGLRTNALGDGGKSRGIWQFYSPAHPQITDAMAYDLEVSTRIALQKMKDGYWRLWTCNKLIN